MHTAFQARSVLETSLHGAANDQSISVGITPIGAQLRCPVQSPLCCHLLICFAVICVVHPGPKISRVDGHRAVQDLVAAPGAAARPGASSGEAHPVRMVLHKWRFPRHRHIRGCPPGSDPAVFCHARHSPGCLQACKNLLYLPFLGIAVGISLEK